ncbi:MAG: hypothetical protein WC284_12570 [Candidimonas sp.]
MIENSNITKTPEFRKWFGNSKVVDEHGNPLVVYHGSGEDISVFDTKGRGKTFNTGAFFTDNPRVANTYVPHRGGAIYPVYLRITNPLIVDVSGANWDSIYADEAVIRYEDGTDDSLWDVFGLEYDSDASTDDIARIARTKGYDGVIINFVKDFGPYGNTYALTESTIYVIYDSTQVKSIYGKNFSNSPHIDEQNT